MELSTPFLAFAAFVVLFAGTPGSSTALVIRNSLRGGRQAGLATVGGIASGNAFYGLACAFGLGHFIESYPLSLRFIRYLGALYLMSLAWKSLRPGAGAVGEEGRGGFYVEGLLAALANASVLILYAALMPPFARPGSHGLVFTLLWMNLFYVMVAACIHSGYALFLGRPGGSAPRWLESVAAGSLLVLAVWMMTG